MFFFSAFLGPGLVRRSTIVFVPREDPEHVLVIVGRNLIVFRQERGWTQPEAAKRLKMSVRHLQRLEAGWNMTIRTAARLARGYRRLTGDLFQHYGIGGSGIRRQPGRPRKSTLEAVQARKRTREQTAAQFLGRTARKGSGEREK